jgi:hypothetical protein
MSGTTKIDKLTVYPYGVGFDPLSNGCGGCRTVRSVNAIGPTTEAVIHPTVAMSDAALLAILGVS